MWLILIIIRCLGEEAFGGRTSDVFVIQEYDTLDELQEHIEKHLPIKCKEPTEYSKRWIINQDRLRDRIVYLHNYLKIQEANYDIMTTKEIKELEQYICKTCTNNDGTFLGAIKCGYSADELGKCVNYDERLFSTLKRFIQKRKKKNNY